MNLEDIVLRGIRQTEKDKHCLLPAVCGTDSPESQTHRNREVAARDRGWGKQKRLVLGHQLLR